MPNRYYRIEDTLIEIDVLASHDFGWGFDYQLDMLRLLETSYGLEGYTFYISYRAPESLPAYGRKVVLLLLADEFYQHRAYFSRIHCVLRCISRVPVYLDGWPTNHLRITGLLHFVYKRLTHYRSVLRTVVQTGRTDLRKAGERTLHLPLGLFRAFEPDDRPMASRDIDVAFLGSIDFAAKQKKWLNRLIASPKVLGRRLMLENLRKVGPDINVHLYTTGDFEQSIQNEENYVSILSRTKISLVPRGTSYETYRFFESCKAGCVIVCEHQPEEWCYENHPGIVMANWSDMPETVRSLLADEALLQEKSSEARTYWMRRCSAEAQAARVASFIEGLAAISSGAGPESGPDCRNK